ncbi:MAG: AbrB/MazE/SpoVT family DNA-binding domain-containing protein [Gammaproteobacteria bacterium]|uniref:AbrB/MazE/SpoVT family DNA-binding domain-containing protein n=1 Tax=Rhodoferax sp. TaxID=50421 RepID=UPI00182F362C|nr:hypothetical protein [Rhodoferax sp.]MBU3900377.1 AbrB/MazE/SpoVT family DNA-binding domain-containing protein [Gammaproteobacteria bacterium]MBA3058436.1 AbrB/MazE/SpoVT family DNA-binding domain-containing protein [Rhodoferax sp.]MBU3999316.1 AbrB/MazE/SpoVT family DNA-binding domain-containing protein [Gammaproteobacteria bacterium]MBU4018963.1 AbrB/MazE/SpoVT family DNA-binding domain-containing protein [Gammaproteobacteria bacterium]MBU4080954.1 AbrB/MazE/SpoVT family DNA-binding domai
MLTTIRQIGNSRGLLIPAAFLASCQIEDQVDLELQDGQILIKPVKRKLRNGWFSELSQPLDIDTAKENDEAQAWNALPSDDTEWQW